MCGRYVVVSTIHEIEKKFNVVAGVDQIPPNYNVAPGATVPVISSENKKQLSFYSFGMTPFWARQRMYLFNARSEGDQNKENDPEYKGGKGIISKPAFRKPIRSQRCLIIADAFYEGPEKERLSKPYLVYLKDKNRPFAFAGIWDEWTDKETGEILKSCAIITTQSNAVTQEIGHHRSPVILQESHYKKWLDTDRRLDEVTPFLKPYPAEKMNAYPVSTRMKSGRENDKDLLEPIGDRLFKETTIEIRKNLKLFGMGETTGRNREK